MTTKYYEVLFGPICLAVYPDEDDHGWYGHCLSTDSIAFGKSAREAENCRTGGPCFFAFMGTW